MLRTASLIMTVSLVPIFGLSGQDAASAAVGQRVRVKTDSGSQFTGTLVTAGEDSLGVQVVRGAPTVLMARRAITRFELSRGRRSNAGKGAVIGGVSFGSLGILAAVAGNSSPHACDFVCNGVSWPRVIVESAALGAGIGALIGAASRSDRWVAVPLSRGHVTLTPRGAGLVLSLTF